MGMCEIEERRQEIEEEHNKGCDIKETLEQIIIGMVKSGYKVKTIAEAYELPVEPFRRWIHKRGIIYGNMRRRVVRSTFVSPQLRYYRKQNSLPLEAPVMSAQTQRKFASMCRSNPFEARRFKKAWQGKKGGRL